VLTGKRLLKIFWKMAASKMTVIIQSKRRSVQGYLRLYQHRSET
jgi:hypothetical protein